MISSDLSDRMLSPRKGLVPGGSVATGDALSNIQPELVPAGALCFVISERATYEFRTGDTTAESLPTCVAVPGGKAGRWHLLTQGDIGAVTQTDWYINATTGSDGNTGDSAAAALASWAELERRLGSRPHFKVDVTIHLLSDIDEVVALRGDCDTGVTVTVVGEKTPASAPLATTAGLTTVQQLDGTANTDAQISDGVTDFSTLEGQRIKLGGGTAVSWVSRDLGSNTARVGRKAQFNAANPRGPVATDYATSEVYDVGPEEMCVVTGGIFDVQARENTSNGASSAPLVVSGIDFNAVTNQTMVDVRGNGLTSIAAAAVFFGCKIRGQLIGDGSAALLACYLDSLTIACRSVDTSACVGFSNTIRDCRADLDPETIFEGKSTLSPLQILDGSFVTGSWSSWDASGTGSGTVVDVGSSVKSQGAVFGSSAVVGSVGITCNGWWWYGTKPKLTGQANDTVIGGAATAYGAVPFIAAANNAMMVATP